MSLHSLRHLPRLDYQEEHFKPDPNDDEYDNRETSSVKPTAKSRNPPAKKDEVSGIIHFTLAIICSIS